VHVAVDCRRGLVKLCGLKWINFYDLLASFDRTRRRLGNGIVSPCPVLLATHIIVSSKREDAEWAEYKSSNLDGI